MLNIEQRSRVLHELAGQAVPGSIDIWPSVNKRSFLPLRTEVRDAGGNVVDRSEVSSVEYNLPIAEATFTYTPPPGIPVANFSGGDGADVKRSLSSAPETRTPPAKSP